MKFFIDTANLEAIREAGGFHEDLQVDRIQLQEPAISGMSESEAESEQLMGHVQLSPAAALLVSERKCSGSETVKISSVKKEFKEPTSK